VCSWVHYEIHDSIEAKSEYDCFQRSKTEQIFFPRKKIAQLGYDSNQCGCYQKNVRDDKILRKVFLEAFIFSILTQWPCIFSFHNSTAMYEDLKTLHATPPGHIKKCNTYCWDTPPEDQV
jgi:hypothetical protein